MSEERNELVSLQYKSNPEIFGKFRELSEKYGGMPVGNLVNAFTRATGMIPSMFTPDPYVQNRRVKAISTPPYSYTKNEVSEMLTHPESSERPLRQTAHEIEYTAYPFFHMRATYQNLLSYHSYIAPQYLEKGEAKKDDFWREWRLLDKLHKEMDLKSFAHMATGQALQEGKVFYYPRVSIDKSHNKVNYAFCQQLPSDYTKIVGFNNVSKYTVAFNLMYFAKAGTDPLQFGDLFLPYLDTFASVVSPGRTRPYVDIEKLRGRDFPGDPDVYSQNGRWYYWVTLPAEKVFTFEIDDTNRNVVSPFTGLFLDMLQLATYEAIQLELVQNPLTSVVTGEIPYLDGEKRDIEDKYKLSNAGRIMFEQLWYQMLSANNTGGIGLYFAPVENMKLHTLAEAPSALEISSNGYSYTMAKAGLTALLPSEEDTRAGVAQISLQIESRFPQTIYDCVRRMMKSIMERLNLKYEWDFQMFGDIATDEKRLEEAQKGMTMGLLPATLIYNAMRGRSILDDMAISDAIVESGLLDRRIPLITSYSAKNGDGRLPPEAKKELNPGGRPESDNPGTDGQEQDADSYGG